MRLDELIANSPIAPEIAALDIAGLTADSRTVKPGVLFAALSPNHADRRQFARQAEEKGAVAVLTSRDTGDLDLTVPIIKTDNVRQALAHAAAAFYAAQPATIVAVTGTNGKTSVASFCQQIWQKLDQRAASIGTLGIKGPDFATKGALTTPGPTELFATLAELHQQNITHAAIELSSHGLDQYRADGMRLKAAGFTNLSRDHLDYHPDIDAYFDAKKRLFTDFLTAGDHAILNADSDRYARLRSVCLERDVSVLAYGETAGDDGVRIDRLRPDGDGMNLSFTFDGRSYRTRLTLAGRFQAWNALCAFGLTVRTGSDPLAVAAALEDLTGAPGRLQKVATLPHGAAIYVDYAHTPGALRTVLAAMRPHVRGRLMVVFGAGGDRDPGKRPMMGEAAAELADCQFVTDDNPRSEDPKKIRAAIMAACPQATEIGDRKTAIETAISQLADGDVLIIAGKGHEQGQTVGQTVLPFDDLSVAQAAVAARFGEEASA